MLGLSGADPEYVPVEDISGIIEKINTSQSLALGGNKPITFNPKEHIIFNRNFLPFHANGMTFTVKYGEHELYESTF